MRPEKQEEGESKGGLEGRGEEWDEELESRFSLETE